MTIASPTAASAAATVMTKITNTCPENPYSRENATNVRFTALSMSSTHMNTMIALRRTSTPTTPIAKSAAEIASDSASISVSSQELAAPAANDDGADDRHEQEHAGDLEREEILVEQRLGHRRHRALRLLDDGQRVRRPRDRRERLGMTRGRELRDQREAEQGGDETYAFAAHVGDGARSQVQQHDHEQEHDHDRAGIHQDLDDADERRVQQHEQRRETEHDVDEPERRGDRAFARHEDESRRDRDQPEQVEVKAVEEVRVVGHGAVIPPSGRRDPTSRTPGAFARSTARDHRRTLPDCTRNSRSAGRRESLPPGTLPGNSRRRCSGTHRSRTRADSDCPARLRRARA